MFFESPSNPMQDLVDVRAVCDLAHAAGATVVVDNVFATPLLQRPLELGADVVVYSATKHIDGQGRVLGGAILGSRRTTSTEQVQPLMRHTGPSMSPFNAWVLLKGLETMRLRVDHQMPVGLRLARWLEQHPACRRCGTRPCPATRSTTWPAPDVGGGTVVTFALRGAGGPARGGAFRVLDALQVIDISNNLGDAKSLVTHPATTTHRRLTPEGRAAAGITDAVGAALGRPGGRRGPARGRRASRCRPGLDRRADHAAGARASTAGPRPRRRRPVSEALRTTRSQRLAGSRPSPSDSPFVRGTRAVPRRAARVGRMAAQRRRSSSRSTVAPCG